METEESGSAIVKAQMRLIEAKIEVDRLVAAIREAAAHLANAPAGSTGELVRERLLKAIGEREG